MVGIYLVWRARYALFLGSPAEKRWKIMADTQEVLEVLADLMIKDAKRMIKRKNGPGPDAKKTLSSLANSYRKLYKEIQQSKRGKRSTEGLADYDQLSPEEQREYDEEFGNPYFAESLMK